MSILKVSSSTLFPASISRSAIYEYATNPINWSKANKDSGGETDQSSITTTATATATNNSDDNNQNDKKTDKKPLKQGDTFSELVNLRTNTYHVQWRITTAIENQKWAFELVGNMARTVPASLLYTSSTPSHPISEPSSESKEQAKTRTKANEIDPTNPTLGDGVPGSIVIEYKFEYVDYFPPSSSSTQSPDADAINPEVNKAKEKEKGRSTLFTRTLTLELERGIVCPDDLLLAMAKSSNIDRFHEAVCRDLGGLLLAS